MGSNRQCVLLTAVLGTSGQYRGGVDPLSSGHKSSSCRGSKLPQQGYLLRRQAELRDPLGPSYGGASGPSSWGAPQLGGAARLDGAPHWNSSISQG